MLVNSSSLRVRPFLNKLKMTILRKMTIRFLKKAKLCQVEHQKNRSVNLFHLPLACRGTKTCFRSRTSPAFPNLKRRRNKLNMEKEVQLAWPPRRQTCLCSMLIPAKESISKVSPAPITMKWINLHPKDIWALILVQDQKGSTSVRNPVLSNLQALK